MDYILLLINFLSDIQFSDMSENEDNFGYLF